MAKGQSYAVSVVIKQGAAPDSAAFTINVLRCDFTDPGVFATLGPTITASTSKIYYLAGAGYDTYVFDKLVTA